MKPLHIAQILLKSKLGIYPSTRYNNKEETMDTAKYKNIDISEVHKSLISDVDNYPTDAAKLLDELTKTERYTEDAEFRLNVESIKGMLMIMSGKYSEVINHCTELVEITIACKIWYLLSFNLNLIANAYFGFGNFERALEFYYGVINNEKEHKLSAMTSISYNNIALIYLNLNVYEKAEQYFRLAIETLERGGAEQFRYSNKLVTSLSHLALSLCYSNKLDKASEIFKKIESIGAEGLTADTLYSMYISKMFYLFHSGSYAEAKKEYYNALNFIENTDYISILTCSFIDLATKFGIDKDYYIKELITLENADISNNMRLNETAYTELIRHYEQIGNISKSKDLQNQYIEFLEKSIKHLKDKQVDSIQIVENMLINSKTTPSSQNKNRELKLVAEEAIRNKNALQAAYDRLDIIRELGIKLTSSLDLSEVIDLIYQDIFKNVAADIFTLMVAEPEHGRLRAVAYYELGILKPPFNITFDTEESLLVMCYKDNRLITSNDSVFKIMREKQVQKTGIAQMNSALYMPLTVGNKTIGVCSVQSKMRDSYSDDDIKFLQEMLPYLSIALNNAVHSWKLEREIQMHIETQNKLKEANKILEKISSIDSLTQISGRRSFEKKFLTLLRSAAKKKLPVGVFMFDIDDFKLYNDTYGHFDGDEALKNVARIVNSKISEAGGIAARFGGEEFISACSGLSAAECLNLAEEILREVADADIVHSKSAAGKMTLSAGIAFANDAGVQHKSELMKCADMMLYNAKNTGKNRACIKNMSEEEA